jgi:hypothetical protein
LDDFLDENVAHAVAVFTFLVRPWAPMQEYLGGPVLLTFAVHRQERVCVDSQVTESFVIITVVACRLTSRSERLHSVRPSCNGQGHRRRGAKTIIGAFNGYCRNLGAFMPIQGTTAQLATCLRTSKRTVRGELRHPLQLMILVTIASLINDERLLEWLRDSAANLAANTIQS